ncbi:ATP-binding cassette domain-containing protein [Brachyspira aalborgi]|uniref:ATP-binding cassette domain-containing protein n=1 Tax=Brachyspira aalborgi TaxID=29522 RepID=A0A5C8GAL5_9SPIR|nr:ATP-binding cassette domain-containing protein [Brachyspira aalborgi]TXJ58896.1 ATP-binding cassette domain-containing protein [Brachyspira aalborgi]
MEIILKNLNAGYFINKKEYSIVIENLNIVFEIGKFHFLAGVSGSGKSTLLETICYLIKKISGEILFDNKTIEDKNNLNIFRKFSGIMLQYTEKQFFNNTVEEEITFNLKRNKVNNEEIKIKLNEILEKLGIDKKLLNASPFEISGGEKRMVALASILIYSPKILFLDEPTAGLDFESKKIFMSSLKSLNKNFKLTIIQSSHILEDIIEYGDTVLILNKNKKFTNGNPRDLLFSKETLNNYGLKEPKIYKYIEELKKFGVKNIDNIKTNSELIKKLFYNK